MDGVCNLQPARRKCKRCGFEATEAKNRKWLIKVMGLCKREDGLRQLVIPKKEGG
uniref:Uncharacterized protein n=1 Tax=Dulem virus 33 TaxID=3145751 RepID=A0AAU8B5L6_9CAUD